MIYSNSAFGPPFKTIARMSTQIEPNYFFGSRDYKTEPWLFNITNLSLTGNVATATVVLISGGGAFATLLPAVGSKMGVQGTVSNGGVFNVDPAIVTASTVVYATGAGTISWALVHANIVSTPDAGMLVVQSAEVPDLVVAGSASSPFALVFTPDESDNSRCIGAQARWTGTVPTASVVVLQGANVDDDSQYMCIENVQGCSPTGTLAPSDALAVITGSAVTQSGAFYSFIGIKFLRAKVLSQTGGDSSTGLICTVFA